MIDSDVACQKGHDCKFELYVKEKEKINKE